MPERDSAAQFRQDPLLFLHRAFGEAGNVGWLTGRQLCLAEPMVAKYILSIADERYQDHSDFFHTCQAFEAVLL